MTQPRRATVSPELILRLQTTVGNRAVQRLMEGESTPRRRATARTEESAFCRMWRSWSRRLIELRRWFTPA